MTDSMTDSCSMQGKSPGVHRQLSPTTWAAYVSPNAEFEELLPAVKDTNPPVLVLVEPDALAQLLDAGLAEVPDLILGFDVR